MIYRDLRDFVAQLEARGELKRIGVEVDPKLEMTEIADRVLRAGGPALLFEKPKGHAIPVLANLFGTVRRVALGMGADVTLADLNLERLRHLDRTLHGRLTTIAASPAAIAHLVQTADVVIGAVLVPGARAPLLVTEEMVRSMLPGAVIVDVAIDQGGCVATIRPTTHGQPTYMMHGVVHYAVTNMPGAVPRTSTIALCNASLPYLLQLANDGGEAAIAASPALAAGLNTQRAAVTHPAVAAALGYECAPLVEAPPARCAA